MEGANPKEAKMGLAVEIVAQYHSADDALRAKLSWEAQFSARKPPEEMPSWRHQGSVILVQALAKSGTLESTSEGRRRIQQGGVYVDGSKVEDIHYALVPRNEPYEVKAGKRAWVKICIS